MSKNKGFTLIELIVTLSILGILIIISYPSINNYIFLKEQKKLKFYSNQTINFINNCKSLCRRENDVGKIIYIKRENSLNFYIDNKLLKKLKYPKDIDVVCMTFEKNKRITIKNTGKLSKGGSIKIQNRRGESRNIAFSVYTDYGKIKQ